MFYLSLLLLLNYSFLCTAMDTSGSSHPIVEQSDQSLATLFEKDSIFNLEENQINQMPETDLAELYKEVSDVYADKRLASSPNLNRVKELRKKVFNVLIKKDHDTINNVLHGLQGDQSDDEQEQKFKDRLWLGDYERSKKAAGILETNKTKMNNIEQEIELYQKKEDALNGKISELEFQLMNLKQDKFNTLTQKVQKKKEMTAITEINNILKKSLSANEVKVRKKLAQLEKEIALNAENLNKLENTVKNLTANLSENSLLKKQLADEIEKRNSLKTALDNQIKEKKEIEFRLTKINEPRLSVTEKIASNAWSLLGYKNNQ